MADCGNAAELQAVTVGRSVIHVALHGRFGTGNKSSVLQHLVRRADVEFFVDESTAKTLLQGRPPPGESTSLWDKSLDAVRKQTQRAKEPTRGYTMTLAARGSPAPSEAGSEASSTTATSLDEGDDDDDAGALSLAAPWRVRERASARCNDEETVLRARLAAMSFDELKSMVAPVPRRVVVTPPSQDSSPSPAREDTGKRADHVAGGEFAPAPLATSGRANITTVTRCNARKGAPAAREPAKDVEESDSNPVRTHGERRESLVAGRGLRKRAGKFVGV